MPMKKSDPKFILAFERGMLRSAFLSLFWAVIAERKKDSTFTFRSLAKAAGADTGKLSNWLRGDPNWTINTIAGLAHGLGVDLQITAVERSTGRVFTSSGVQSSSIVEQQKPMRVNGDTETVESKPRVQIRGPKPAPETSAAA